MQSAHRILRLVDPFRALGQPQRDELREKLVEIAAGRGLLGDLAESRDRNRILDVATVDDRGALVVEHEPGAGTVGRLEGTEIRT